MSGERLPADFLQRNVPRHLKLIAEVVAQGQREGAIIVAPMPMLVAYVVGAVAGPLLLGSALEQHALMPASAIAGLKAHILSESAMNQRIGLVIRGLQAHIGGASQ
jgi:hypothetical protein